jgi:hypothetical protein
MLNQPDGARKKSWPRHIGAPDRPVSNARPDPCMATKATFARKRTKASLCSFFRDHLLAKGKPGDRENPPHRGRWLPVAEKIMPSKSIRCSPFPPQAPSLPAQNTVRARLPRPSSKRSVRLDRHYRLRATGNDFLMDSMVPVSTSQRSNVVSSRTLASPHNTRVYPHPGQRLAQPI